MKEEERLDQILREEDHRTESDFSINIYQERSRAVTDYGNMSDSGKE